MNKLITCLTISVLISCGDDSESLTREEIAELMLAEMETNSTVMDDVVIDGKIITAENTFKSLIETANTRDSFLATMQMATTTSVKNIFEGRAGEVGSAQIEWSSRAMSKMRYYLALFPVGYQSPNPGGGLLDMYWSEIQDSLARNHGGGMGAGKVTVQDIHLHNTPGIHQFSLNYSDVEIIFDDVREIVLTAQTEEQMDQRFDNYLSEANADEASLIGLLRLAILRIKESDAVYTNAHFYLELDGVDGESFSRDIRLCALYATMEFFLSHEYQASDHHAVSLAVLYQAQQVALAMFWAKAFDVHH